MGITRFSGPVYGSKATLFSFGPTAGGGGSTALAFSILVPPYETWYLTEMFVANPLATSNTSNNKIILKVKGTSTSVTAPGPGPDPQYPTGHPGSAITVTGPTSTAGYNLLGTATADAGEYEGYAAPANSSIRVVSSGTIGLLYVTVAGYKRYLDSTRAV